MLKMLRFSVFFCVALLYGGMHAEAVCERPNQILAAEDICWTSKVKIADRIQYTTKSVLNFAKEKLGIGTEEEFHPQKCDYYECIFKELKMLKDDGYPNYDKLVEWIDNNIIYNQAKIQYDRLQQCSMALSISIGSNTYFNGDLKVNATTKQEDLPQLQDKCEVLKEFMKCLALSGIDCEIFKYP